MEKVNFQDAWKNIFDKYGILSKIKQDGFVDITATQIKAVNGKEARLMAKIDFRENLPIAMQENGLSLLAIKNGTYRIVENDPFMSL